MYDRWDDLFLSGAFAPREILLGGLTLQQVSARPDGVNNSIYQELWHVTTANRISLDDGRMALGGWPHAQHFPSSPAPASLAEWHDLVASYLEVSQQAVKLSHDHDWLETLEPGLEELDLRWRDCLAFLAVHSAYHMGKIVTLRQLLGTWPPPDPSGQA